MCSWFLCIWFCYTGGIDFSWVCCRHLPVLLFGNGYNGVVFKPLKN
jgi:hypothetical protein